MGRTACAYRGCKNSRFRTPNVSFHRFPKNETVTEWIIRCGDPKLFNLTPVQLNYRRVCSDHFEKSMFHPKIPSKSNQLKHDIAIPKPYYLDHPDSNDDCVIVSTVDPNLLLPEPIDLDDHNTNDSNPNASVVANPLIKPLNTTNLESANTLKLGNQINNNDTITNNSIAKSPSADKDPLSHATNLDSTNKNIQNLAHKIQEDKLLKKITKLKSKYTAAQRQIKNLKFRLKRKSTRKRTVDEIIDYASIYLNSEQLTFFGMQLRHSDSKIKEWTKEEKRLAVSLFFNSQKTYGYLRERLKMLLPAVHTIRRWVNSLEAFAGLNKIIFPQIENEVPQIGNEVSKIENEG